VAALLNAGANPDTPNAEGWTPLMLAAYNGHDATVRRLLAAGANANAKAANGSTPLRCAALNAGADSVRRLLEAGADFNYFILQAARKSKRDSAEKVRLLSAARRSK